jgi:tol-pal system protein YbgF
LKTAEDTESAGSLLPSTPPEALPAPPPSTPQPAPEKEETPLEPTEAMDTELIPSVAAETDPTPAPASREDSFKPSPDTVTEKSSPPPDSVPAAAKASDPSYQKAMEILRNGDYESAASLFEDFVAAFPEDDLADNALYWAGECKYTRKDFTGAIQRFMRVVEEYPTGSKVPDALLKIGFAYISLGDMDSAETYLKEVIARYPFSSAGDKAEERLKTIQSQ